MNCTGDNVVVPGTLDTFFTVVGVLVSGLFVGFAAVATLVYKPSVQEDEEKVPYEQKYYEEFSELEERDLEDDEVSGLKEKFVCETTPSGDVIICYNKDQESFDVWHDDRNIPFMVLDAVAQHYAIEHDVKAICVDYKHEYDKAVEKMKEAKEQKETKDEDKQENKEEKKSDNVFANFKDYNVASEKSKSVDNKIVTDKCNRFRRVGDIKEWHDVHDKRDEDVDDEDAKKEMSYKQFKSMQESAEPTDAVSEEDKKEE